MFGLVVRFDLRDEDAASRFDQLVDRTVPSILEREPNTVVYAVHPVDGSPLSRIFYELYHDRAAFEEHEATEHVKHFLAERQQYLTATRVEFLGPPRIPDASGSPS